MRRHFTGIVREKRHEVQAGLEDGTQVLCLPAEFGEVAGMRGAVAFLGRQEGEHVVGEVAAVAAGTAMGGDASDVGPATHRVRAHAEHGGDVADA